MNRPLGQLLWAAGLIGALSAGARAQPETPMPLEVQLDIAKTDLLVQQNPACVLTYKNTGKTPLLYLHPAKHENSPMMRIIESRTGAETFQMGHAPELGEQPTPMPPGMTVPFKFRLRSRLELTMPGDYEVSAVVLYDRGKERAESNKQKIKIRPVAARAPSIVSVSGGWAASWYVYSVNGMAEPPEIVRHALGFSGESGVEDALPVVKAPLLAEPVASSPQNLTITTSQWVAWLEGDALRFTHFNPDTGSAPTVGKWALPGKEAQIIAPLFSASDEDADPPAGAAVVWIGDPVARTGYLQVVDFTGPGKSSSGARTVLSGYRPLWAQSLARSNGKRLLTLVTRTDRGVALQTLPWPNQALASNPLKKLAEFKAEFVAGGTLIDPEDTVMGAALMIEEPDTARRPVMVRWSLDAKDQFTLEKADPVEWPYGKEIHKAVVRVGPDGMPAALLADQLGNWFFYDGYETVTPAPAALAMTKLPLDMIFMDRGKPLLIGSTPGQGLKVVQPDGKPLPHKCG